MNDRNIGIEELVFDGIVCVGKIVDLCVLCIGFDGSCVDVCKWIGWFICFVVVEYVEVEIGNWCDV